MQIIVSYFSNVGGVRSNNEDSLLINDLVISDISMKSAVTHVSTDRNLHLFCVADGVGGHTKGEMAGKLVLEFIKNKRSVLNNKDDIIKIIKDAKIFLNDFVVLHAEYQNFGTTIAGILINLDQFIIFSSGDSRVYLLNDQYFERITRDHTLIEDLYQNGLISEDDMRTHPQKNIIRSAIFGDSSPEIPEVFIKEEKLRKFDTFLICSDGVWETLTLDEIEEIYTSHGFDKFADVMLDTCLKKMSKDNITLILVHYYQEEANTK